MRNIEMANTIPLAAAPGKNMPNLSDKSLELATFKVFLRVNDTYL